VRPLANPTPIGTVGCSAAPVSARAITYTYDEVQELTGAGESPGCSFAYGYDPAGNRTSVTVNNTQQATYSYNAANEVQGWTYDAAGNLTNDGATTFDFASREPARLRLCPSLAKARMSATCRHGRRRWSGGLLAISQEG
jgi:YD repeat-containing protein